MKKILFLLALSFTQLSFAQNFDIRTAPSNQNSKSIYSKQDAPLVVANGQKLFFMQQLLFLIILKV